MPESVSHTSRKYAVRFIIAAVIFALIFIVINKRNGKEAPDLVTVTYQELANRTEFTGTVVPERDVDLGFIQSGRVELLSVSVGDRISAGEVLAVLDDADTRALVAEANASLQSAESTLEDLRQGATPEEIRVQESKVEDAEKRVALARQSLVNTILATRNVVDDALFNRADDLFENARTSAPNLILASGESTSLEKERVEVGQAVGIWDESLVGLSADLDLSLYNDDTFALLHQLLSFLDRLGVEIDRTGTDTQEAAVSVARTNVDAAVTTLTTQSDGLENAESALQTAEDELLLKLAGNTDETIAAQAAQVKAARAALTRNAALLDDTVLRTPISGIVSDVAIEKGEIAPANVSVISVIADTSFEIDANVSELDISYISVGMPARVTLDAYGDDVVFTAHITNIDPAETIINGVSTYGITLTFDEYAQEVRSGLTANVATSQTIAERVLAVPLSAVSEREDETIFVQVYKEGVIEQRTVSLGARSLDGLVEIREGLSEGEEILRLGS